MISIFLFCLHAGPCFGQVAEREHLACQLPCRSTIHSQGELKSASEGCLPRDTSSSQNNKWSCLFTRKKMRHVISLASTGATDIRFFYVREKKKSQKDLINHSINATIWKIWARNYLNFHEFQCQGCGWFRLVIIQDTGCDWTFRIWKDYTCLSSGCLISLQL